ncbi:MAG: tetratricopeptide repeat protein [Spirochaetia bacterium]|nr:tetratricopeptide repeat protein [Spirochaetia bacterium]
MKKTILIIIFIICPIYGQNISPENIKTQSATAESLNWEGISLGKKGRYEEAIEKFKQAISIEDNNAAGSYNNMGYTYELAGNNLKAVEAYRKAIERNPNQIISLQNLGKLLYFGGRYKESIEMGEKVIELDPENKDIHKWLPDAYKKEAEQRLFALKKMQRESEQIKDMEGIKEDSVIKEGGLNLERPGTAREYKIEFSYFINNLHLYQKSRKKLLLQDTIGRTNIPMGVNLNLHPSTDLKIRASLETPYFGIFNPNIISEEEKLEFLYMKPNAYYGIGLFFAHADLTKDKIIKGEDREDFIINTDFSKTNDFKIGFVYGQKSHLFDLELFVYPRYLFRDKKEEPYGISLDRSYMGLKYKTALFFGEDVSELKDFSFLPHFILNITLNDFFLTEYKTIDNSLIGHYFAVYEISAGFEFGKIYPAYDRVPFVFGFLLAERIYFKELNEEKPFAFGNGQGWAGFDSDSAVEGDSFPTYRTNSHVFTIYAAQLWQNIFFMRQKITYELSLKYERFNALSTYFEMGVRF